MGICANWSKHGIYLSWTSLPICHHVYAVSIEEMINVFGHQLIKHHFLCILFSSYKPCKLHHFSFPFLIFPTILPKFNSFILSISAPKPHWPELFMFKNDVALTRPQRFQSHSYLTPGWNRIIRLIINGFSWRDIWNLFHTCIWLQALYWLDFCLQLFFFACLHFFLKLLSIVLCISVFLCLILYW